MMGIYGITDLIADAQTIIDKPLVLIGVALIAWGWIRNTTISITDSVVNGGSLFEVFCSLLFVRDVFSEWARYESGYWLMFAGVCTLVLHVMVNVQWPAR